MADTINTSLFGQQQRGLFDGERRRSPEQMRQEILKLGSYGRWEDDAGSTPSAASHVASNAEHLARYQGLSGEDKYTVMAWLALRWMGRYERLLLDQAMLRPPAPMQIHQDPRLKELLAWAHSKLHDRHFPVTNDALRLDEIKRLLEHGV